MSFKTFLSNTTILQVATETTTEEENDATGMVEAVEEEEEDTRTSIMPTLA